MLWILPTPAAPWICRHDGVIDDVPIGAHKYAARPTLPFARRFGFEESQHFQLWLNAGADDWILTSDFLLTGQAP